MSHDCYQVTFPSGHRAVMCGEPRTWNQPSKYPAPGQCADGGSWYPLRYADGSWEPICQSDPRYALALRQNLRGMGELCPPCTIPIGTECTPCPPGAESTIPECEGCVGGRPPGPSFWQRSQFVIPVMIGVATTLMVGWILKRMGHSGMTPNQLSSPVISRLERLGPGATVRTPSGARYYVGPATPRHVQKFGLAPGASESGMHLFVHVRGPGGAKVARDLTTPTKKSHKLPSGIEIWSEYDVR